MFATERSAVDKLIGEGIAPRRVTFVGNVMIDTLHACLERAAPARATLSELGAASGLAAVALEQGFAFVTLHRLSNVDDLGKLESLLAALVRIARRILLVFPRHLHTQAMIESAGLDRLLCDSQSSAHRRSAICGRSV